MTRGHLSFILLWALLLLTLKVFLALSYDPVVYADSLEYAKLAREIQTGSWETYDGYRTPVYPLFILMFNIDYEIVAISQSLLGLLSITIFVSILYTKTRSWWFSLSSGFALSLYLHLLFMERTILTESISIFLLLSLVLFLGLPAASPSRRALCLGVLVALLALTRPLFLATFPLVLLGIAGRGRGRPLLWFSTPVLCAVLGWCAFNKAQLDYFGPSTTIGFNLTNHSGAFMERAPARYARLRDIYLEHRAARVRDRGTHSMTIFFAMEPMMAATGMKLPQLSRELTRLSLDLFLSNPLLYIKSVSVSWIDFWKIANYWEPERLRIEPLRNALMMFWRIEKRFILLCNFSFLLLSVYHLCSRIRSRAARRDWFVLWPISIVLVCSVVQALMERGENARYAIPLHPLVLLGVSLGLKEIWARRALTSSPTPSAHDTP